MKAATRRPTMLDSLRTLRSAGVTVNTVLDVGVLNGTPTLIKAFPDTPHRLFEPVPRHAKAITKAYRHIEHKLHPVAVSDVDGSAWLCCRSINNDGKVTHAEVVSAEPDPDRVDGFVEAVEIPRKRLDTILQEHPAPGPFLLKIDVDGHEMAVLEGARATLEQCSTVVIEAPLMRLQRSPFFARAQWLLDAGFLLMDIVDPAYYRGVLWQVDLVFVRSDVVVNNPQLLPFETPGFQFVPANWSHLS